MSSSDSVAPAPFSLIPHAERPGFCVAHAGPLVVPVWTTMATGEHVDLIGETQRAVLGEHPMCTVVTIIRAELSMGVDDEVREKGKANIREFGDSTLRNVMVVEDGGLRATFFRSVVTGLYFFSRKETAQKVTASIDEGVEWALEPFREGVYVPAWPGLDVVAMGREVRRFADACSAGAKAG